MVRGGNPGEEAMKAMRPWRMGLLALLLMIGVAGGTAWGQEAMGEAASEAVAATAPAVSPEMFTTNNLWMMVVDLPGVRHASGIRHGGIGPDAGEEHGEHPVQEHADSGDRAADLRVGRLQSDVSRQRELGDSRLAGVRRPGDRNGCRGADERLQRRAIPTGRTSCSRACSRRRRRRSCPARWPSA